MRIFEKHRPAPQLRVSQIEGENVIGLLVGIVCSGWWIFHEVYSNKFAQATKNLSTGPLSLASILVGLGVLCLRLVVAPESDFPADQIFLALIGFFAVVAGALLVDSVMDLSLELPLGDRLLFMNGGYLVFCCVMSAVAFALLADAFGAASNSFDWRRVEPWFVSTALLAKVLTKDKDYGIALLMLLLGSVYSWVVIWNGSVFIEPLSLSLPWALTIVGGISSAALFIGKKYFRWGCPTTKDGAVEDIKPPV